MKHTSKFFIHFNDAIIIYFVRCKIGLVVAAAAAVAVVVAVFVTFSMELVVQL